MGEDVERNHAGAESQVVAGSPVAGIQAPRERDVDQHLEGSAVIVPSATAEAAGVVVVQLMREVVGTHAVRVGLCTAREHAAPDSVLVEPLVVLGLDDAAPAAVRPRVVGGLNVEVFAATVLQ